MFHADPDSFTRNATVIALPQPLNLPLPPGPADDPLRQMRALRRPAKLIRAARIGLPHYRRARDLRRLLRLPQAPAPLSALRLLLIEEDKLNHARQERQAEYSLTRHLEIWIAALAEADAIAAL